MANSGRTVVAMLVGVALFTLGCEDKELATTEPKPVQSQPTTSNSPQKSQPTAPPSSGAPVLAWAEVLEQNPDPRVVTDTDFLKRITETKLPWRVKDKASGIVMLLVPPGKFVMGMSPGDSEAESDERPAHEVTITKPFYLGRTEVTQEQWVKVMGNNPSRNQMSDDLLIHELQVQFMNDGLTKAEARVRAIAETELRFEAMRKAKKALYEKAGVTRRQAQAWVDDAPVNRFLSASYPVERVSWDGCQIFCAKTALQLPTEAQWEYACRSGVRAPQYGELDDIAWWAGNSDRTPREVALKLPNALGFYDMLGNVTEWVNDYCSDEYYNSCEDGVFDPVGFTTGTGRVLRGGAFFTSAAGVRSSERVCQEFPDQGGVLDGFRVARAP
jgi:formylglycine-generating enzyme required for sulfatase activity